MLVGCVTGPDFASAKEQILEGNRYCDAIELRVDLLQEVSKSEILELLSLVEGSSIVTGSSEYPCDYLSVDWDAPTPKTDAKIIRVYHNFDEMPEDLEAVYQSIPRADVIKMACMAHSTLDAMRMLVFMKDKENFSGMGMGPFGQITRILGPVVGNVFTFSSLGPPSAPGQLPAKELQEIYRFSQLSPTTKIFGLIGNPVEQSIGHLTHNRAYGERGLDAVYCKMLLERDEIPRFFSLAKEVGISGLSVTRPFKEEVIQEVDHLEGDAPLIGAVNTLTFDGGELFGSNTDAEGALDAIEEKKKVEGKRVVILGAGGAAKAIAYEAKKRGANLAMLNRSERGREFADKVGAFFGSFSHLPEYDILINTTPVEEPFDRKRLLPRKLVMDITNRHAQSPWMLYAKAHGCTLVYGLEMFHKQAERQLARWFCLTRAR